MAEMVTEKAATPGSVQATATGAALADLQAKLAAVSAAGGNVRPQKAAQRMVVVGRDDPVDPGVEAPQPQAAPAQKEALPEGGFDKFYNAETGAYNWQAHAKEAEFRVKMAQKKAEKTKPVPESKSTEEGSAGEAGEVEAKAIVKDAGLDWGDLTEKVSVLGELDADDYAALEGIGVPRDIVDMHIQGLKAVAEITHQKLMQATGGEEGLEALLGWATANLAPHEIDAYNEMLADQRWPVAIDALKARSGFVPGGAKEPQLLRPAGISAASGSETYANNEEFMADIKNPLYKTSEAFRQKVYAKRAKSSGIARGTTSAPWQQRFRM